MRELGLVEVGRTGVVGMMRGAEAGLNKFSSPASPGSGVPFQGPSAAARIPAQAGPDKGKEEDMKVYYDADADVNLIKGARRSPSSAMAARAMPMRRTCATAA
jgi:hypothetical protein